MLSKTTLLDNLTAPLSVKSWTDKNQYELNDKIKVFVQGNKPFYLRVVYKDAHGNLMEHLATDIELIITLMAVQVYYFIW